MSLVVKILHALAHPRYLGQRLHGILCAHTRYSTEQWARSVMYSTLFREISLLGKDLVVLEISSGGADSPWRRLGFKEYISTDYPDFDICRDTYNREFDLIIADQVFEHLLWPYRAARNVYTMLRPNGTFINTTPFLIRVHENPVDCSRWTEIGMKYLLMEAGFDASKIRTGSWGNLSCVRSNLAAREWARVGWGRLMHNDPAFPVAIWALATR